MHHAAIAVRDFEASLRFWRDGLGLETLMDLSFAGDWKSLFDIDAEVLHSAFLGDPSAADAGIVELVEFKRLPLADAPPQAMPTNGFFLLSLNVDVSATLARLADLGLGGTPTEITVSGVRMAVVRDPDGVRVELIDLGELPMSTFS